MKRKNDLTTLALVQASRQPHHNQNQLDPILNGYLTNHKSVEAFNYLTTLLENNPHNSLLRSQRGELFRRMGDHSQAISDLNAALETNPNCFESYNSLAWIWYKDLNDLTIANLYYDRALAINPNYSHARIGRGLIHFERKHFAEALIDINVSLSAALKDSNAYAIRGFIHFGMGELDAAIADLSNAIAFNKYDVVSLAYRAMCFAQKDQTLPALKDLIAAANLSPLSHSILKEYLPDLSRKLDLTIQNTRGMTTYIELFSLKLELAECPLGDHSLIDTLKTIISRLQTPVDGAVLARKTLPLAPKNTPVSLAPKRPIAEDPSPPNESQLATAPLKRQIDPDPSLPKESKPKYIPLTKASKPAPARLKRCRLESNREKEVVEILYKMKPVTDATKVSFFKPDENKTPPENIAIKPLAGLDI